MARRKKIAAEAVDQQGSDEPSAVFQPDFATAQIAANFIGIHSSDRILDYGCGNGRLAVALASMAGEVVGLDSDWTAIEHCRSTCSSVARNAHFEAFQLAISDFPPKVGTAVNLSPNELKSRYSEYFDLVCSFEAFARLGEQESARALRLFARLLKRNGYVLLACQIDMNFAPTDRTIESSTSSLIDAAPMGLPKLLTILESENFRPLSVTFGTWRTDRPTRSPQQIGPDLILAMRQSVVPSNFSPDRYLELNPDVAAAKIDPLEHYLLHGFYEGRRIS